MAKQSLTIRVSIEGVREVLRAMDALPKDVNDGLREESKKLAEELATRVRADGMADAAPQSPDVARTTKAVRDRVPVIQVGGTQRVGRRRAPAYKLLFGSVFGSNSYRQFHRPHAGTEGYWIFPTIERNQARIAAAWNKVADDAVRKWAVG